MVARAVSPTSAATSTMFAAATMPDFTARFAPPASNDGSSPAEPMASDKAPLVRQRSRMRNNPEGRHETPDHPRRADFDIQRNPQSPGVACGAQRRPHIRVEHSAL